MEGSLTIDLANVSLADSLGRPRRVPHCAADIPPTRITKSTRAGFHGGTKWSECLVPGSSCVEVKVETLLSVTRSVWFTGSRFYKLVVALHVSWCSAITTSAVLPPSPASFGVLFGGCMPSYQSVCGCWLRAVVRSREIRPRQGSRAGTCLRLRGLRCWGSALRVVALCARDHVGVGGTSPRHGGMASRCGSTHLTYVWP